MDIETAINFGLADGYAEAKSFGCSVRMPMVIEAHQFAAKYARYVERVKTGESQDKTPVTPRQFWYNTYA